MRGAGISAPAIMSGCRADIEQLLDLFKEKNSLRYDAFFEVFKEIEFNTIFWGKMSVAELVEFSEKLLQMAISYAMVCRRREEPDWSDDEREQEAIDAAWNQRPEHDLTLQERLFGIYLTYTLYVTQPFRYVTQVRVSVEQLGSLETFLNDSLIPEKHYDAVAILQFFGDRQIFRIVSFEKDFDVLTHRRYDRYILEDENPEPSTSTEYDVCAVLKTMENEPLFQQVNSLHKWYVEMKKTANLDTLNMVRGPLEIYNDVMRLAMRRNDDSGEGSHSVHRRLELKAKAFKSRVESLRSRRLGRQRLEVKGDDGGTDSSQTTQQWNHLYSVSVDDVIREATDRKDNSQVEDVPSLNEDKKENTRKRKKLASISEVGKLLDVDAGSTNTAVESAVAEMMASVSGTSSSSKGDTTVSKQNETDTLKSLAFEEGGGQSKNLQLPDVAVKACVTLTKSKEERKGDAILKRLSAAKKTFI
uniref:snRNA-activating protein complex subunit 1 n=2 Tax=Parascaris univalens TaxID=6257 RepID=A0A914ZU70_PARUN